MRIEKPSRKRVYPRTRSRKWARMKRKDGRSAIIVVVRRDGKTALGLIRRIPRLPLRKKEYSGADEWLYQNRLYSRLLLSEDEARHLQICLNRLFED